jgi:hypothetical protein
MAPLSWGLWTKGPQRSLAKQPASDGYAPIPSPLWQDAMPRRRESQYAISWAQRAILLHFEGRERYVNRILRKMVVA